MRLDIDKVTLQSGAHSSPDDGLCVVEAVAYIAREQHSDHPVCVSPVIATFLRSWNDALSTDDRQRLKDLIPVVMDTVSTPEDENRRAWMCVDWLVRGYTPAWLRLAGLSAQADRLANLPQLKEGVDVPSIGPVIEAVRSDAAAAWTAAWDAARTAAWDAARTAAWDAAGEAAGAAAWAAAWDAARTAAREAAREAAGAAAWAATWAATGAATRAALRQTVVNLQTSAMALVERMAWLKDGDDEHGVDWG
jgi:hypothetical protein